MVQTTRMVIVLPSAVWKLLSAIATLLAPDGWPSKIAALVKENGRSALDAVIDSGGDDIMGQIGKYVKDGGKVVCYGM